MYMTLTLSVFFSAPFSGKREEGPLNETEKDVSCFDVTEQNSPFKVIIRTLSINHNVQFTIISVMSGSQT